MILFSGVFPFSMLFQAAKASTVLVDQKWRTSTNFGNGLWEGGIVIGDVNKTNPGEEIVFATDYNGGRVFCLDGNTGKELWHYDDSSIYAYAQTQLYDLDGDGNLEVCVPTYYLPGILVLRSNGTLYWKTYIANGGTTMGSFVAADVDGDGKLEIFHGSQNVEAGTNNIFVGRITKLSYNGKILAQTFNWRACSGGVSIADTNNDGQFEIFTGDRDMYMGDGDYGKGVRSFWASNLTQRWNHPDILSSSQCPVLADVDGDGVLDVIVSDMSGGVVVLNSTSGSAKSISPNARFRDTGNINVPGHYQETVGDVDGDGHLELVTADGTHSGGYPDYSNQVVIYDLYTGQVEARLNVGLSKYAPTLANLTGGSTLDIIVVNMTSIFIFRYDSSTKTYTKLDEVDNLLYGLMYGIVQDIDNDGKLEVVVGRASGTSSQIYAFDTNALKPSQPIRSEVRWYSEYRRGVAEYIAPPAYGQNHAAVQVDFALTDLVQDVSSSFGKTTAGSSYTNLAQYWYGSRYQISENGTASSISLYVQEMNGENRPLTVAIYDDNSGKPNNLLAQGTGTVPAGFAGWINVTLSSSPDLFAGDYYWLTANAIASTKNVRFYYSAGTTNQGVYGTTTYASFPPNPCTYSSLNSRAYSIYCNYTGGQPSIPGVVSTVPTNGTANVPVSSTVVVTFNITMNTASVQAAFSMTPSTTGSFSWSLGDTVMTFTPASNLHYGTSYNATITAAAQSKDGKNLTQPYTWAFQTAQNIWVLQRQPNGDLLATNTTNVDPSIPRVFNWYVNDYKNPTTTSPTSLTNVLMTFDTSGGTGPVDYSPYDNNGINYGASWTSTHIGAYYGGAYLFDGVSDYIQIPDGSPGYFNGSNQTRVGDLISNGTESEMTLELWVYLSENQNNVRFVSKIPSYEIGLSFSGSNRLFAGVWTQTGTDFTDNGFRGYYSATSANNAISINSWHQVALTYKDGQGLRLYLDGNMVASYSGASGNIHCSSGEPMVLGWFDYFHGMISQVRLYPKSLSGAQISQRYAEVYQAITTQSIIKSAQTRGQETWMCEVITNGQVQLTNSILIPNNPPSADNLAIGPRQTLPPLKTDNLTAIYSYHDPDENNEIGSQIRWYQNGNLRSDLNDMRVIPSSATTTGDTWYFTVRLFDGNLYGTIVTSAQVNIVVNNPPTISPAPSLSKDASGNLTCSATANDPDGPTPTRNIYSWQVNGASIVNLQMPFDTDSMLSGAKDYSPNANNGVISGATWTPNGVVGGALHFDGTDVVAAADKNLGGDAAGTWTELTIEFWIKLDTPLKGTRIVAKKVGTSSTGSYMIGFQTSDPHANALFFGVTTPAGFTDTSNAGDYDTVQPGNVLQVGVWYHILCTYKSGPGLTIYVNGTQTVNLPLNGTITTETEFVSGDEPLFIGSDGSAQPNRYLKGTLDELLIYTRAFTPQQAYQRYAESKNGQSNSSIIVAQETRPGQTWTCVVTPNDKYQDGPSVQSNSVVT
jgi:hypothetical protein